MLQFHEIFDIATKFHLFENFVKSVLMLQFHEICKIITSLEPRPLPPPLLPLPLPEPADVLFDRLQESSYSKSESEFASFSPSSMKPSSS